MAVLEYSSQSAYLNLQLAVTQQAGEICPSPPAASEWRQLSAVNAPQRGGRPRAIGGPGPGVDEHALGLTASQGAPVCVASPRVCEGSDGDPAANF